MKVVGGYPDIISVHCDNCGKTAVGNDIVYGHGSPLTCGGCGGFYRLHIKLGRIGNIAKVLRVEDLSKNSLIVLQQDSHMLYGRIPTAKGYALRLQGFGTYDGCETGDVAVVIEGGWYNKWEEITTPGKMVAKAISPDSNEID